MQGQNALGTAAADSNRAALTRPDRTRRTPRSTRRWPRSHPVARAAVHHVSHALRPKRSLPLGLPGELIHTSAAPADVTGVVARPRPRSRRNAHQRHRWGRPGSGSRPGHRCRGRAAGQQRHELLGTDRGQDSRHRVHIECPSQPRQPLRHRTSGVPATVGYPGAFSGAARACWAISRGGIDRRSDGQVGDTIRVRVQRSPHAGRVDPRGSPGALRNGSVRHSFVGTERCSGASNAPAGPSFAAPPGEPSSAKNSAFAAV